MGCGNSRPLNTTGSKAVIRAEQHPNPPNFVIQNPKSFQEVYKLGKLIGSGSFGDVRAATHIETGEERAVKLFKKSLATTDKDKRKLFEEIQILRSLDHPNIVKIFEYFEDMRRYYIVMEYCRGGELFQEVLRQEHFSEQTAATILQQLFSAVGYLHSNNIMHRDLKPENILLEDSGDFLNIKLIDFGTAIRFNPGSKLRTIVGTAYYIAPEVLKGAYTEKCDMWSCGVIIYILLSGFPPFDGKSDEEIIEKVKKCSYNFGRDVWKNVSNEAKDLIYKLLAQPDVRISAEEALQDLWVQKKINRAKLANPVVQNTANNLKGFMKGNKLRETVGSFIVSQCLSVAETKELRDAFKQMDINGDGKLSKEELFEYFSKDLGGEEANNEVIKIFSQVDTDGSGYVDYSEFLKASIDSKTMENKKHLKKAFDLFDSDGSGTISADELKKILTGGSVAGDDTWAQVIKEVDKNGDGVIDFEEFETILLGKI